MNESRDEAIRVRNETIRDLVRSIRALVGLFDPYGRGRINEPESECADVIARATEVADAAEDERLKAKYGIEN